MKTLLSPKTVAVIGASRETGKIGYIIFDNLLSVLKKNVYPVNPNCYEILGQKAYKSVLDIKNQVDLAIIAVPAKAVCHVLEGCGKKGVKTAIIISAGFSESGHAGKEMERELLDISKKFGIRLLGPNCLGVINNFSGFNGSFASSNLPAKYRVGIFSQSGAMGAAILDFANGENFGFSYFVSLGNKSDISEIDLIESWVDDKNVEVAIGYLEDIKDGQRFLEAAKKFTAKKPLIILKGGVTKEGSKTAHLHTAALVQNEVVFRAAMEEAGVILAENLGDLFELAVSFSENPLPKGKNLAVISNAGGPTVLAADSCALEGVTLAGFVPATIAALSKTSAVSLENPVDLRGDAKREDYKKAIAAVEKDKNINGILIIATPQAMTEIEDISWEIVEAKRQSKKPIYVNFIGGELTKRGTEILRENGVPCFSYPERAVRAFSFQATNRKAERETTQKKHSKHHVVKSLINFSGEHISSARLSSILNHYGIKMAKTILVKSSREAKRAISEVKPPAVMKIFSYDILHKTDVGGVIMGIMTEEEAAHAYDKIIANVKLHCPGAKIEGVTVMETAKEGLEVIVGGKQDPVFGPVLMFGFGGIFVELVADYGTILAPFTEKKVRKLISKTAVSKILEGYRGKNGYSTKSLVTAIMGVGALISEHPEIQEIEINPLVISEEGEAMGLDAKIEMSQLHHGTMVDKKIIRAPHYNN